MHIMVKRFNVCSPYRWILRQTDKTPYAHFSKIFDHGPSQADRRKKKVSAAIARSCTQHQFTHVLHTYVRTCYIHVHTCMYSLHAYVSYCVCKHVYHISGCCYERKKKLIHALRNALWSSIATTLEQKESPHTCCAGAHSTWGLLDTVCICIYMSTYLCIYVCIYSTRSSGYYLKARFTGH